MRHLLLAAAALLTAGAAQASITPTFTGTPVAAPEQGEGIFSFTYTALLASDQQLVSGSFFTLYDVAGFTGFGMLPSSWTGSSALLGNTPPKTLPSDDAGLQNVTFTYNGPTLNGDAGTATERQLGTFEIFSTVGTFGFDDFTSWAQRNSGLTAGSWVATVGQDAVAVPGQGNGGGNPNPVPEPATWAMLLAGFSLVGATMRRRKGVSVVSA